MLRIPLLVLSLAVPATYADTIYKSVDDEGNIIYSSEPPAEGRKVRALEPPAEVSDEEREAAAERQRKLHTYLDETGSEGESIRTEGETRREAARRRAIWGKDWPIHEPINR